MSRLLMNLRHVPDDEADEVRSLLDAQAIDYFETPPNRWGISAGGIWLSDETVYTQARQLLDDYERERAERMRAAHEEARQQGTAPTFVGLVRRQPLLCVGCFVLVLGLLYISIRPFFGWTG